jgi:hypothetical protein
VIALDQEALFENAYEVLAAAIRSMYGREFGLVENVAGSVAGGFETVLDNLLLDAEKIGLVLLYVGKAKALRTLVELVETLDEGIKAGDINIREFPSGGGK